jgi:predicted nucleic acid-binding protein
MTAKESASVNKKVANYVLDTSAILSYFLREEDSEKVVNLLNKSMNNEVRIFIPFPVVMELYYIVFRASGRNAAEERFAALKMLPVAIDLEISEQYLLIAGSLKAEYPISFADSLIAAYAKKQNATLVHKDPEYLSLDNEIVQQKL